MRKSKIKLGGNKEDEKLYNNNNKQTKDNYEYDDKDTEIANYNKKKIQYNKYNKDLTFYLKEISLDNANDIEINNDYLNLEILNDIILKLYPDANISDKLTSKFKFKKGGASLLDDDVSNRVRDEYNIFNNFIMNRATLTQRTRLENIIDNIGATGNITDITIMGSNLTNLRDFIRDNNSSNYQKNININIGNSYVFSSNNDVPCSGTNLSYQLHYQHKDYNKNIVEAFQKNFIDNHQDIQALIRLHNIYISLLPSPYRCTINDYTNPNGYRFYSKYFKSNRPNWLEIYTGIAIDTDRNRHIPAENDTNQFRFGDAFLPQIKEYCDNLQQRRPSTPLIHAKLERIIPVLNSRLNSARYPIDNLSDFYNILHQDDWNEILKIFEIGLNNIIILAPTIDKEIYCYRGADRHVIENQHSTQPPYSSLQCYQTSRITSFSISFDCAKNFYYSEGSTDYTTVSPEACIYRTTIMRGAKMLFIEQLTTCQTEYEFITPSNTVIIDPYNLRLPTLNQYIANHSTNIKYNNIDNRFGISGKLYDQIQSIDIIIIGS